MSDLAQAQTIALQLLLAQLGGATDAVEDVAVQIEPDVFQRPDRMRQVLMCLLGTTSGAVVSSHHGNKAAAIKTVETWLAQNLDRMADDDSQ